MDRFVSQYMLRLDAKGRVSIPAPFRAVLSRDGFDGLYCYPALDRPALDAGGNALLTEIEALIAGFSPYSDQREQFALALYGPSETLKIDGEGRVVLTETLKEHTAITDMATFVGLGHKFQIWEPGRFRAVLARDGFDGLYCYPTLDQPALDAGGNALLTEIESLMTRFPPFSDEREQFAAALYGTSETLKIDGEGRVILTDNLKAHAGITDAATFVGLGHKFQIWEPGRFRTELAEATQKVRALKKQLGSRVEARGAHGARE